MAKTKRLPEVRVKLQAVPSGGCAVPLEYPANLGLRTKLGGDLDWIQDDDTPECPHCGKWMTFVAQVDSIDHDSPKNPLGRDCLKENEYMFGDVGMIYVFFCFECCQPGSVHQCY